MSDDLSNLLLALLLFDGFLLLLCDGGQDARVRKPGNPNPRSKKATTSFANPSFMESTAATTSGLQLMD